MEREQDRYHRQFYNEYVSAAVEVDRLQAWYKHLQWYNFEVACSAWRFPWHESEPFSTVTLRDGHGKVIEQLPVCMAEAVPMQIVESELRSAIELKEQALKRVNWPYDYAPGGTEYETVQRQWYVRSSNNSTDN